MALVGARERYMNTLRERFSDFGFWKRLEVDCMILVAKIPETEDDDARRIAIEKLAALRALIMEEGIEPREIQWIDEELQRLAETFQMSLYTNEQDTVSDEIIDKYANLAHTHDGVVGIHLPLNFKQCCVLSQGVHKRTQRTHFYISRETVLYGQIVAARYDHAQTLPVAHRVMSRKKDEGTGQPLFRGLFFIGQPFDKTEYVVEGEVTAPFHIFTFISDKKKEYVLFVPAKPGTKQPACGDYIISGVSTELTDNKLLSETARLTTKLPIFFAQNIQDRIVKYENHEQLFNRMDKMGAVGETFFNFPFSGTPEGMDKTVLLDQPNWLKWFIWAWICHSKKGAINKYPMHFMMLGAKGAGKTALINVLHQKSGEPYGVFRGAGSTFKMLIPSFAQVPANIGHLAKANRYCFCDELFRVGTGTRDPTEVAEIFAKMNDLLEHQRGEFGSAKSSAQVQMRARLIADANPPRREKTMIEVYKHIEESFLSRWLVYFIKEDSEHVKFIRGIKDRDIQEYTYKLDTSEWVSFTDYLWTFDALYDKVHIDTVFESYGKHLPDVLKSHYDARHRHHIACLIDGLVKARCILERDASFTATEKDYERLDMIWRTIIASWLDGEYIRKLPIEHRLDYLSDDQRLMFDTLCDFKKPVLKQDLYDAIGDRLSPKDKYATLMFLYDYGAVKEDDGFLKPHYMNKGGLLDFPQEE